MAKDTELARQKTYSQSGMVKIARKICTEYKTGLYSLESCCDNAGVPYRTWKEWWARYNADPTNDKIKAHCLAEVADLWKESQESRDLIARGNLKELCETNMERLIKGWEYKETKTDVKTVKDSDGQEILVPVGQTITTKQVLPNAGMIQFALKSVAPQLYGERSTNLNVNVDAGDAFKGRTLAEIDAEIEALENGRDKR